MSITLGGSNPAVTFPDGTIQNTANNNLAGPAFSVYSNSGQSFTSGQFTKIAFQNKIFDTANAFDATTNNRFQPLIAGYYQINGNWYTSSNIGGACAIFKNGSENFRGVSGSNIQFYPASTLLFLNGSTDYVELYFYNGQGSTVTNVGANFNGSLVRVS